LSGVGNEGAASAVAKSHGWNNLHESILAETDKTKQDLLRRQALLSDYYLGSVHALAQDG